MKPFNIATYKPTDKVINKNGDKVRILDTTFKNVIYPVVGAVEYDNVESIQIFTYNGKFKVNGEDNIYDLFIADDEDDDKDKNPKYFIGRIEDTVKQLSVIYDNVDAAKEHYRIKKKDSKVKIFKITEIDI